MVHITDAPARDRRATRRVAAVLGLVCIALVAPTGSATAQVIGQPGHDGPAGVISGVVNTYWGATASAAASATSITVGAGTGVPLGISPGDMVLVIQMQDATINSSNTSRYGQGVSGNGSGASNWNTVGRYEYVIATSALSTAGGTLRFRGISSNGLLSAYTNASATSSLGQKRFQIVRVPQYSSGTLAGATAYPWDGARGGVLALDVAGTLNVSGASGVDGIGFRGGGGESYRGPGGTNTDYRRLSSVKANGIKGEGVAGTPMFVADATQTVISTGIEGYPNGAEGKGAPGNAGGGATDGESPQGGDGGGGDEEQRKSGDEGGGGGTTANTQNAGGGGGAGAGSGGQGGRTWSSALDDGGRGGSAFPSYSVARVVMGGGAGAGSMNDGTGIPAGGPATSGAPGGGIVLIRANAMAGAGSITANGASANNTVLNDGSGGGGGGGSIIIGINSGSLSGITVCANGGVGGTNTGTGVPHGPGGGGGGGFIQLSAGGAATCVDGGANGTTASGSQYGASFGATPGSPGIVNVGSFTAPGATAGYAAVPVLTVTKTTSTPTVTASFTNAVYTMRVAAQAGRDTARDMTITDTLPAGFSFLTPPVPTVTLSGGATRPTSATSLTGATTVSFGTFTIPASGSVQIQYTNAISKFTTAGTKQNAAQAYYLDPARTTSNGTTFATYNPLSSTGEDVLVIGVPVLTLAKTPYADDRVTLLNGASRVFPGRYFQYKVTATNSGGAGGLSVVVTDSLPSPLVYDSVSPDAAGWTISQSAGTVKATLAGTLAIAASRFFWVRVKVK